MPKDKYSFSREQILEINYEILQASPDLTEINLGGNARDTAMLDFLCEEIDEIEEPIDKAATALQKIAIRHPFIQGNKRTAVAIASIILNIAGYEINTSDEKLNIDVRKLINDQYTIEQVRSWLTQNIQNIQKIEK